MSLQCGIVGAGIAGLGAAIALRRAGHEVELFERSSFKHEIGAAITMTPNANLVLDHWGFDAKKAGGTDKHQFRRLKYADLECDLRLDLSDVPGKFGHDFCAFHRVDLHHGLRELATSPDQPGPLPIINLGKEVATVDRIGGVIKLHDGEEVKKDLIVIADGFKCHFEFEITQVDIPLTKIGKSVYRTLIPMNKLMADPQVRPMLENEPSGFLTAINPQAGVLWVAYPCRKEEVMNLAMFHNTRPGQHDKDDWNSEATVQDAVDVLREAKFHPAWEAFVRQADEMKCYTVGVRDPLPRLTRGKAVVIGDAAHMMQPTHAQGGSISLEDAASLETFFSPQYFDSCKDSIEKRLELWNQFRLPRVCVTKLISNAMFYNLSLDAVTAKIRTYYAGPIPSSSTIPWSPPIQDFFYSYDVFKEAEKAMAYKDAEGGILEGVIEHFGLKAEPDTINVQ